MPPQITIDLTDELLAYYQWYSEQHGVTVEEEVANDIAAHVDGKRYRECYAEKVHP
jgi:hypothetical protein